MSDELLDLCSHCSCDMGTHWLVATTSNPEDGGIMLCPTPGCTCYRTWAYGPDKGPEDVTIPSDDDITYMRATLQGFFDQNLDRTS